MSGDRHSEAEAVELIKDPSEKARRETENGIRQFNYALDIIKSHLNADNGRFRLKQSLILTAQQKALSGIHALAGTYRNSAVHISKSDHLPPAHIDVPDLVAEMCDYVNSHWEDKNAIHLASYVLWRMNWIHPFADGNGRTARVVSYVILSIKLKSLLPGTPTIPDQIASDKEPYYRALEKADHSWRRDILALSEMESMMEAMLARQLLKATQEAAS